MANKLLIKPEKQTKDPLDKAPKIESKGPYRVDKLTPEQEAMIPSIRDRWSRIGRYTGETNQAVAEQCLIDLYLDLGQTKEPKIKFFPSPKAMILQILKDQNIEYSKEAYNKILNEEVWFIQWWAGWRVFYKFCMDTLGIQYDLKDERKLRVWTNLCMNVHAFAAYDGIVYYSDYPCHLECDKHNRLSSTTGPALAYRDGLEVHALGGDRFKDVEEWKKATETYVSPQKTSTNQDPLNFFPLFQV